MASTYSMAAHPAHAKNKHRGISVRRWLGLGWSSGKTKEETLCVGHSCTGAGDQRPWLQFLAGLQLQGAARPPRSGLATSPGRPASPTPLPRLHHPPHLPHPHDLLCLLHLHLLGGTSSSGAGDLATMAVPQSGWKLHERLLSPLQADGSLWVCGDRFLL